MTRGRTLIAVAGAIAALACAATPAAALEPASYVDPMIGTFAPGFIFPGADVPFGMVQNSPDTEGSPFAYGGYLYTDPLIRGVSLAQLSGPGEPKAREHPLKPTPRSVKSTEPVQFGSPS